MAALSRPRRAPRSCHGATHPTAIPSWPPPALMAWPRAHSCGVRVSLVSPGPGAGSPRSRVTVRGTREPGHTLGTHCCLLPPPFHLLPWQPVHPNPLHVSHRGSPHFIHPRWPSDAGGVGWVQPEQPPMRGRRDQPPKLHPPTPHATPCLSFPSRTPRCHDRGDTPRGRRVAGNGRDTPRGSRRPRDTVPPTARAHAGGLTRSGPPRSP